MPEREGMTAAISVSADKPDSQNDGKLIYVTGELAGVETLADSEFGVAVDALKLRRRVWTGAKSGPLVTCQGNPLFSKLTDLHRH